MDNILVSGRCRPERHPSRMAVVALAAGTARPRISVRRRVGGMIEVAGRGGSPAFPLARVFSTARNSRRLDHPGKSASLFTFSTPRLAISGLSDSSTPMMSASPGRDRPLGPRLAARLGVAPGLVHPAASAFPGGPGRCNPGRCDAPSLPTPRSERMQSQQTSVWMEISYGSSTADSAKSF